MEGVKWNCPIKILKNIFRNIIYLLLWTIFLWTQSACQTSFLLFFQLLTYRIFYFWRWCMEISCFFFYQYSVWVSLGSIKAFFEMNSKIWQYMCHLLRTNINTQDFVSFDLFFCELELCFLYFLSCHWR